MRLRFTDALGPRRAFPPPHREPCDFLATNRKQLRFFLRFFRGKKRPHCGLTGDGDVRDRKSLRFAIAIFGALRIRVTLLCGQVLSGWALSRLFRRLAVSAIYAGWPRFGSVTVWRWNCSSGSGFRLRWFPPGEGFSLYFHSALIGKNGSDSEEMVPTVLELLVSSSGSVPEPPCLCEFLFCAFLLPIQRRIKCMGERRGGMNLEVSKGHTQKGHRGKNAPKIPLGKYLKTP